jgi:hypothetical protein
MTRLKDFLVGICSSGELSPDQALGRFVWVITQSPFTKDLGFKTRAAISTFQRVFLLNTASLQLYSIAMSAGFIPNQPEKEIIDLLSVTGRVFYYSRSNSWHPVPNYELNLPPQTQSSTRIIEPVQSSGESEQLVEETINDLKVSNDLGEPLKTIWLYAKKKGEVIKASEVQRDNSTLKSVPTKKIRQYFGLLFDLGYGELEGEGDRLGFRAY